MTNLVYYFARSTKFIINNSKVATEKKTYSKKKNKLFTKTDLKN